MIVIYTWLWILNTGFSLFIQVHGKNGSLTQTLRNTVVHNDGDSGRGDSDPDAANSDVCTNDRGKLLHFLLKISFSAAVFLPQPVRTQKPFLKQVALKFCTTEHISIKLFCQKNSIANGCG